MRDASPFLAVFRLYDGRVLVVRPQSLNSDLFRCLRTASQILDRPADTFGTIDANFADNGATGLIVKHEL